MASNIEMQGTCLVCDRQTVWYVSEGWVFQTVSKHWRCGECRSATQPHLFLPPNLVRAIHAQVKARRVSEDDVIEIEV